MSTMTTVQQYIEVAFAGMIEYERFENVTRDEIAVMLAEQDEGVATEVYAFMQKAIYSFEEILEHPFSMLYHKMVESQDYILVVNHELEFYALYRKCLSF